MVKKTEAIKDKLLEQLTEHFSEKRLMTYVKIAKNKALPKEYAVDLYRLNILICEELYAFMDFIEVCLRNKIHNKMTSVYKKENWYDDITWYSKAEDTLTEAKKIKKGKNKKITPDDVISRLNFGFWCHIFDGQYEQKIWISSLNKLFPNYISKPSREHISRALLSLLKIRNRISHFEPIIKNEQELLKNYNQMVEIMNWMSPEIYMWFKTFNNFDKLYDELTNNRFVSKKQSGEAITATPPRLF